MQYTFEITIAGCNTRCAHCSVNGGQGVIMPFEDYLVAINKLEDILASLKGKAWITLGNEIFNHPQISDIMTLTQNRLPNYYGYPEYGIPTSAITLMARKDKNQIIEALRQTGVKYFMVTLHGGKDGHNLITKNSESFDAIHKAAEWLAAEGFTVIINLMLNKFLVNDWDSVKDFIKPYKKEITIPFYMPTDRLRGFQKYRANYNDCQKLRGKLAEVGIDEQAFFCKVEENNEKAIRNKLEKQGTFDYALAEKQSPDWAFFNITQDLNFYYGNAGVHTKLLGNLKTMTTEEAVSKITKLSSNYDWSAFYTLDTLPNIKTVLEKNAALTSNYVYPTINDCIFAWIDNLGVNSILLRL